ncbi:MAG: Hsp20/alpha crystallin family protein [Deltaproteobacteria bacterium]|nr:MAG: Hsp20/alpha crystallin family protein [Deltaproteobacteria bacterium]
MELVRWNPNRNLFSARYHLNNLLNDFFAPYSESDDDIRMASWNPRVDIYNDADNIVLKAELPGVEKKDISVDCKGRVLTLKGELASDNEVKEDNYYRKERFSGRFERSFTLPGDVDPENIKADYKNGILTITVPKPEDRKKRRITIN